jgi:hypothetical protein
MSMSLADVGMTMVEFVRAGYPQGVPATEIGAAITRITDEPPSSDVVDRVQRRLEAIGWPSDPNG